MSPLITLQLFSTFTCSSTHLVPICLFSLSASIPPVRLPTPSLSFHPPSPFPIGPILGPPIAYWSPLSQPSSSAFYSQQWAIFPLHSALMQALDLKHQLFLPPPFPLLRAPHPQMLVGVPLLVWFLFPFFPPQGRQFTLFIAWDLGQP